MSNIIIYDSPILLEKLSTTNYLVCSNGFFRIDKRTSGMFSTQLTAIQMANPYYTKLFKTYVDMDRTSLGAGSEGYISTLSKVPEELLRQILTFFKYYADQEIELEAMANIYVDRESNYFVDIPIHRVSKYMLHYDMHNFEDAELVVSLHSHHYMPARFSPKDDMDQQQTGIYSVISFLSEPIPTINTRIFCSRYVPILTSSIFQIPSSDFYSEFPKEWLRKISVKA